MMSREHSEDSKVADIPTVPSAWWKLAIWALALGAFTIAMGLSYREIHYNVPNDLRSPVIMLVDALLASVVALGFAVHDGSLPRWTEAHLCLRFGLWTAAVFRLLPPMLNEGDGLYLKNCGTFDVPYVVLGACIHGGLAVLFACPYAIHVLNLPVWHDGERLWEMCGAVILVFFIVASIMRLLA